MKREKKIFVLSIICVIMLFVLWGCDGNHRGINKENDSQTNLGRVLYSDEDVTVNEIDILNTPEYTYYEWIEVDNETAVMENDVIFEGTIDKITEIAIKTEYLDYVSTIYKTIIRVNVKNIVYDDNESLKIDDNVDIAVCVSSRTYDQYVASFVEGAEYLFFAKSSENVEDDTLKIGNYSDFYIDMPEDYIIPIINKEFYEVGKNFSELVDNTEKVKLNDIIMASEIEITEKYEKIFDDKTGYKVSHNFSMKLNIGEIDGKEVLEKEILHNVANKKYESISAFRSDINRIYVISQDVFLETINDVLNCKVE